LEKLGRAPVQDSTLTSDVQSSNPWVGDGTRNGSGTNTSQGPYRILMNGSSNYVDLSTPVGTFPTDVAFNTWIRPNVIATSATGAHGTTILSNGGGASAATSGIEVLQSSAVNGVLELAVAGQQSWESNAPAVAPLVRYRLNETTLTNGSTITDSSGNGYNGTIHSASSTWTSVAGGPPGTTDKALNSASTATTGNYVVSNTAFLMTGFQVFSIEVWFKSASAYNKGGYIFGFGSTGTSDVGDSSHDRKLWMDNTGKINWGIWNGSSIQQVTSAAAYNDGNWHYVAVTYNYLAAGGTMTLNVDQAAVVTLAGMGTAANAYSAFMKIGSVTSWGGPTNTNFVGSIDEFSVYSSVLTQAQITARAKSRQCRTTTVLSNFTFYNVGVTFNNSTKVANVYVNGNVECTATYAGALVSSSLPFTAAARPLAGPSQSNFWEGAIGNVRVYNSSATSMSTIYTNTSGLFP
jgi:hypothetical protein